MVLMVRASPDDGTAEGKEVLVAEAKTCPLARQTSLQTDQSERRDRGRAREENTMLMAKPQSAGKGKSKFQYAASRVGH